MTTSGAASVGLLFDNRKLPALGAGRSAQPTSATPDLFHLTCDHCAPSILASGALIPAQQPFFPHLHPLIWLTDDPSLSASDLGLTRTFLACDRTAHRFRVLDTSRCFRWSSLVAFAPPEVLSPPVVRQLEHERQPEHWWCAALPIPVVLA